MRTSLASLTRHRARSRCPCWDRSRTLPTRARGQSSFPNHLSSWRAPLGIGVHFAQLTLCSTRLRAVRARARCARRSFSRESTPAFTEGKVLPITTPSLEEELHEPSPVVGPGVISVVSAFCSFGVGSDRGGVAQVLYVLLFPALILGSYRLFLFRERGAAREPQRRELGYVLGIGARRNVGVEHNALFPMVCGCHDRAEPTVGYELGAPTWRGEGYNQRRTR